MKVTTSKQDAQFQPVALTLTFESQKELDTFTALMARKSKVPAAVFHRGGYPSQAVVSLDRRGITEDDVRNLMEFCFTKACAVGGNP